MKMKIVDIAVTVVFVVAIIALIFLWGCHVDPVITIIAGVVVVASGILKYVQYKKLKDMQADSTEK